MAEPTEIPATIPEDPIVEDAAAKQEDQTSEEPEVEEDILSKKVTLADLSAKGTALYAHKHYDDAAAIFSEASVLQAEINGELAPENAEILFHYGRCLFKVGQSKSDVLGAPGAGDKQGKANGSSSSKPKSKPAEPKSEAEAVTQEGVALVAEKKEGESIQDAAAKKAAAGPSANKPLFQFTGDENFDESDDEEEAAEGEDQEEEEDDLAIAFEILDLARVCYLKLLELKEAESAADKGKEVSQGDSPSVRHIKERLADTHDCLAEISLENERYPNAIEDGRTSLKYKTELYPEESEIIAEAHYKLSLALEFASVTTSGEEGTTKREAMDQGLRDEAAKEMELAIKSCKLKTQNKEVDLATMASPEDNELARKEIAEMKEVIADMEQRLVDLKSDPIDAKNLLGADANPLGGILGATLGETPSETKARVEEAKKTATDLSGLVRKKKPAAAEAAPEASTSNGKRKAEDEDEAAAKKAKTEEPEES